MATGLPVVASQITGVPELVDDGRSGVLVVPGRGDELTDALARVLTDPDGRLAMGREGRAKVEAEFDLERTAPQLLGVFRELIP
jgi:glycosyltransferase involved in cell wall biosynthesis